MGESSNAVEAHRGKMNCSFRLCIRGALSDQRPERQKHLPKQRSIGRAFQTQGEEGALFQQVELPES